MGDNKKMGKNVKFNGKVVKKIFIADKGDFKIYAVEVDKKQFSDIKMTIYNNVTIKGIMPVLTINQEYEILAEEIWDSNRQSYSYNISSIQMLKPRDSNGMYEFLKEILTERQAKTLYDQYPNIVDLVMSNQDDCIDLSKLNGIGQATYKKIKQKIIDNYCVSELVIDFGNVFSYKIIKKLYDYYKSVDLVKQKLQEDPYKCLCGLSQVGFVTADELILKLYKTLEDKTKRGEPVPLSLPDNLEESSQRCLSCILYLLRKNEENGNTVMSLRELYNQINAFVPECANKFFNAIKNKNILSSKKRNIVCLKQTYEKEKYIANKICLALDKGIFQLESHFKNGITRENYRIVQGNLLSKQQQQALDNICEYPISILNGYAGSGKSFSTQAIVDMCVQNEIQFKLIAPTGRAAKVLQEYSNQQTFTVHRLLGAPTWEQEENSLPEGVIIIDESSMCDLDTFWHLIYAIDFSITRLLIIGDNAQLPSVGCGNILHDLLTSNIIPTTTLTKIFRYDDGGLMKVATDTRDCLRYLSSGDYDVKKFGENEDYIFVNTSDANMLKKMAEVYKKMLIKYKTPLDIQVLTAYRKGTYGSNVVNNILQEIANPIYSNKNNQCVTKGDTKFYNNDIVIQTKNNYKAIVLDDNFVKIPTGERDENGEKIYKTTFIANGEIGKIEKIDGFDVYIRFDNILVGYKLGDMSDVDLGYCLTIHKCQGGSIKCPILLTPTAHTYMLSSNLLYVALTRTKEQCYHFGNYTTVNRAVKKKNNLQRHTMLCSLLKKNLINT